MISKEQKIEELKIKIKDLLNSPTPTISLDIFFLLEMNKTPKDCILEYINKEPIKISILQKILYSLCSHNHPKINKDDTPHCSFCNAPLDGWFCSKSPDNICHYFSIKENGQCFVELSNGKHFTLPQNHQKEYENDDECLFCGEPEERK